MRRVSELQTIGQVNKGSKKIVDDELYPKECIQNPLLLNKRIYKYNASVIVWIIRIYTQTPYAGHCRQIN